MHFEFERSEWRLLRLHSSINMESNSFRKLELLAHVKQIAEIHGISLQEAITYCIKKLEAEIAENEERITNYKNLPSKLMVRLGEEKYNMFMDKYVNKVTSSSELSQAYYQEDS